MGLKLHLAGEIFVLSNYILNRIQSPHRSELIVGKYVVNLREPAFHSPVNTGRDFAGDDFYEVVFNCRCSHELLRIVISLGTCL
ncbi:MAG: hypothetical protein JWO91_3059 [Acidobacteriaceae bacterium]|jgi:hypothetical protein|nr:hypothetical protein [Acidobacteriaceae bacterium]